MKELRITLAYKIYSGAGELSEDDRKLLAESAAAAKKAYAPYSCFHVGSAIKLSNGITVTGNNQENVAYPSGLCAERVALFHAGAQYPDVAPIVIAISCYSEKFPVSRPVTPCGSCRQVMAESELRSGKPIRVIMAGAEGEIYVAESIKDLLPLAFEARELKEK